jgi:hypothetical protein
MSPITKAGFTNEHHNPHLPRLTGVLALTAASFAVMLTAEPLGADGASAPSARSARSVSVNEQGQLHLVSKHGFTLNEQGTASGTIKGPITVQLKIVSSSRVTAEVTISPRGGSISGSATASYHRGETSASFSGSLTIKHGSGSYDHAEGSGLSFSGTIARSNEAVTVHVSGSFSD